MAIAPVGPYTGYRYPTTNAPAANYAPAQNNSTVGGYAYTPGYGTSPTGGGSISLGKVAAWAAGGFAAWRYVLPLIGRGLPGLVQIGVVGAGAWLGNKGYNMVTGGGTAGVQSGQVGRYVAWAGGAYGAFRVGTAMMQSGRPTGLFLGALLAGGAFAGNWLYNKLTGQG